MQCTHKKGIIGLTWRIMWRKYLKIHEISLFPAKSLPLHCVVESVPSLQASFQVDARSPWRRRPNIEMDSYIIVPASTPFCDIVTIALQRLGYSSDISNTAKGNYSTCEEFIAKFHMHFYLIWLTHSRILYRSNNNQKLEATSTR